MAKMIQDANWAGLMIVPAAPEAERQDPGGGFCVSLKLERGMSFATAAMMRRAGERFRARAVSWKRRLP